MKWKIENLNFITNIKNIKGKNSAGQKYDLDPVLIEII